MVGVVSTSSKMRTPVEPFLALPGCQQLVLVQQLSCRRLAQPFLESQLRRIPGWILPCLLLHKSSSGINEMIQRSTAECL